jgi:hypothetical protein
MVVAVVCATVLLARSSKAGLESRHAGSNPVASARLKKVIGQVLQIAEAAVSDGEDVLPFAITEGGESSGIHNFVDAKVLGLEMIEGLNYRNSVEMGRKFLSTHKSDAAVFAYSAHVQIGQLDTDAVLIEACERDVPVTFRFAQPYVVDGTKRTGALEGSMVRIPDGPPDFTRGLAE